ncbi:MAG: tRNA-dihydrouridine synthase family protein, partial [Patescibacteria group bacterium]
MVYGFWEKLQPKADPPLAGKQPFFVLAPMADVTDAAFRQIILQCGKPDVLYTEFVSCDGLCSLGRERLIKDLIFTENERPIVAQFFGSKPENFYKCAELAKKLGFDGIDINMGCPDRKMIKQGAGIGLCKTPELAREII